MALLIRGPLIMADGHKAKSLEDLKEHFSLETVLQAYYDNGRLSRWLQGLGLEDELDAIQALDDKAPDFAPRLCAVFQVPYTGDPLDQEAIQERLERLKRLKRVTDEVEHHRSVDRVAFCQEELARLVLEEGETLVYLCQEEGEDFTFTIPSSCRGVTYHGIPCKGKQPRVRITRKAWDKLDELDIHIHSCDLQRPEPNQAEPEEPEGNREEPVWRLFQKVLQEKNCGPDTVLTMKAVIPSLGQAPFAFQGTVEKLERDAALLAYDAAGGMELTVEDVSCRLRMRPDFFARAQVHSAHIERNAGGGRAFFIDLARPIRLNGRKYRSVEVPSDKYEGLNLLEGSEIDVFCLGDLPPVVRVYERGGGRTLRCPHCGSRFMARDNRVFCENPVCPDRLHGRIYRFLQKLELPYDEFFVQKMITELPVKSIKDLFQIDSAMLEQHHLDSEEFRGFSEKLRQAVAAAPADSILGGIGIPGLDPRQAAKILTALSKQRTGSVWDALVQSLELLWDQRINQAAGDAAGNKIQAWLRCDPRTMGIFRDDIVELQKYVNPGNPKCSSGFLRPGAYIYGTNFLLNHIDQVRLLEQKGLTIVTYSKWQHYAEKIAAVVLPFVGYTDDMVKYAKSHEIPTFLWEEFYSAFLK